MLYNSLKSNLFFVLREGGILSLILAIMIFSYNYNNDLLAFAQITVLEALDYEYVIIGTDLKDRLSGSIVRI